MGLGAWAWGLRLRAQGFGLRAQGVKLRAYGFGVLGLRAWGLRLKALDLIEAPSGTYSTSGLRLEASCFSS